MERRRVFINDVRLHINYVERKGIRNYKNRTKIVLLIPGTLFFDINSIEGQINGQEPYTAEFLTENGYDSAYFIWSQHTKVVKRWKKLKIDYYVKELKEIIDYLLSIGYSSICLKTTSFGSVPVIEFLKRYDYSLNVKKVIMDGANFSSATDYMKRQLSINKLWKNISDKNKEKISNDYNLTKKQKDIILDTKYNITFFEGELEKKEVREEIEIFSRNNDASIIKFENAGHLVYVGSEYNLENYNRILLENLFK